MKDFFAERKELFYSFSAIFIGVAVGFTCARLINEKLSNHAFYNCPAEHLSFTQDVFMGGKYICLKK